MYLSALIIAFSGFLLKTQWPELCLLIIEKSVSSQDPESLLESAFPCGK
jgi:hypothetical protein